MAETLSIDQFTEDVAAQIASQLKIDTSALVKSLVESLSKGLVDKILINKSSLPIPQEKAKQSNPQQTEKQKAESVGNVLSRATEQALSKIPILASALTDFAKNKTSTSSFFSKDVERYFQSLKTTLSDFVKATPKASASVKADATEPSKTFLEKETVKEQQVLFDGFTQPGLEQLSKVLPDIFKKGLVGLTDNKRTQDKQPQTQSFGAGMLKDFKNIAGLAGLGTLLFALETDGPFKGIAKLASKGLLHVSGWTKLIDGFVGKFLKKLIDIPFNLIKTFKKSFTGILGKEVGETVIKTGLGKFTGFIAKFLAGATRLIKRIPFVGSLISIGMAFSRFKQGDVVGGGLEVLSGIANLFPGIGTGVSIAIDGLNAFLDYKAGGTPAGGGKSKGGILLGWVHDLNNWIYKNFVKKIRTLPIIGPLIKAIDSFKAGQWKRGLKQLAYTNPAFEVICELLGDKDTTGSGKKLIGAAFKIEDLFTTLTAALMKKVKEWWKNISSGLRYIFSAVLPDDLTKTLNTETPVKANTPKPASEHTLSTARLSEPAKPTEVTEENNKSAEQTTETSITPEEPQQPSIQAFPDKSSEHLSKLVENSDTANRTMANLVVGFNTLAKALEKLGVSVAENGGNTTVINSGGQAPVARTSSASDYIKSGNSSISSFRNFIEQARQTPA